MKVFVVFSDTLLSKYRCNSCEGWECAFYLWHSAFMLQ